MTRPPSDLAAFLDVDTVATDLPAPSYNIAPTARAAIVLDSAKTDPPTRRLEAARWGLVPGWAKDISIGARAFNARAEEVEHKPMFRGAVEKRRAIVPTSGYYEWANTASGKVAHYLHPADHAPLLLAGLYEWWKNPAAAHTDPARWVLSFTILTRAAVGHLASIHDRSPLCLDVDHAEAWLDTGTDNIGDVLDAAIDASPSVTAELEDVVVGTAVGNVRNDGPELIEPAQV